MKRKFLFLVILAFLLFGLTGCGSLRKVQKVETSRQETTQVEKRRTQKAAATENTAEAQVTDATSIIDAIMSSATEITYTKVEYFPPLELPDLPQRQDTEAAAAEVPEKTQVRKPEASQAKPPDAPQGAIKSIETYAIKHGETAKAIKKDSTYIDTKKEGTTKAETEVQEDVTTETEVQEDVSTEPAKDPYRWRYILGIVIILAVVLIGAYFVLRKSKILGGILATIRKIF